MHFALRTLQQSFGVGWEQHYMAIWVGCDMTASATHVADFVQSGTVNFGAVSFQGGANPSFYLAHG